MFLRSPGRNEFVEIFERFAESRLLDSRAGPDAFVQRTTSKATNVSAAAIRGTSSPMLSTSSTSSAAQALTADVLDRAFDSCFADNVSVDD